MKKKKTVKKSKVPARKTSAKPSSEAAGPLIDARIRELGGWRGALLKDLRRVITSADPAIFEEWKWSVPVWSLDGIICTGESYKSTIKMTFPHGASLPDPQKLFNSSLKGNTRRAIDFHEGEKLHEKALQALIRAAVKLNQSKK